MKYLQHDYLLQNICRKKIKRFPGRKFINRLKLLAARCEESPAGGRRSQSSILYYNFFCVRLPHSKATGIRSQDSIIIFIAFKYFVLNNTSIDTPDLFQT
jgi:hypothetical protein